jgi:prepilin-type N-terminal cleavage/methylation domain-containing protein
MLDPKTRRRACSSSAERGFTLVELMTVVVIVGVLATVGIASFRRQVFGAKTSEVVAMIQSIRAAEERWKAENLRYLNVSTAATWYPATPNGKVKRAFYNTGACTPVADPSQDCRWKLLNPTVMGPVQFGYMVTAGGPADAMTTPAVEARPSGWSGWTPTGDHWFVVQAIGDADGDGVYSKYLASSVRANVYQDNAD